jgi:hypothetical protein
MRIRRALRRLMWWRKPEPEQISPSVLLMSPELRQLWQEEILRQSIATFQFEENVRKMMGRTD